MKEMEKLTDLDLSGLKSEHCRKYIVELQKHAHKTAPRNSGSLQKMAESDLVEDGFKEILNNLLLINPYFRWTASECLAHPIFDDIRDYSDAEVTSSKKLKLDVDQCDAFNYEEGISEKYKTNDYMQSLLSEADIIH